MRKENSEKLGKFWAKVRDAEQDVLMNCGRGHVPPHYIDMGWDENFAAAYDAISNILRPVGQLRLFETPVNLLYQSNPIKARNAHEALMHFLNPPHLLYGERGVLESPEYLQLKQLAKEELQKIQHAGPSTANLSRKSKTMIDCAGLVEVLQKRHFNSGTKSQFDKPFTQKEIAEFMGWSQPKVSRYMDLVFKNGGMSEYVKCFRGKEPPEGFKTRLDEANSRIEAINDRDLL